MTMLPKAIRPYYELCKTAVSFLTVLVPLLEKWQTVLPVASQVRQECLTIAVFVCFLAAVAGYSTGRHTLNGLSVGWCFLLLFLGALSVQLAGLPRVAWAERPLYVLIFAFFSLSTSAFLAYSARKNAASIDWQEHSQS
ncbi:MAG: hypothetical protein L0387_37950 [Acidobacteria bacterium]|nr:hypothetical protein [Acidobacteriota bacterium]MCI0627369.1 hypothetical protein [Acidobacteriota bacterium]MCI0719516.1 hypothetical protein [Acidobacteriota bacterium]